jgi:hypothetical protein
MDDASIVDSLARMLVLARLTPDRLYVIAETFPVGSPQRDACLRIADLITRRGLELSRLADRWEDQSSRALPPDRPF